MTSLANVSFLRSSSTDVDDRTCLCLAPQQARRSKINVDWFWRALARQSRCRWTFLTTLHNLRHDNWQINSFVTKLHLGTLKICCCFSGVYQDVHAVDLWHLRLHWSGYIHLRSVLVDIFLTVTHCTSVSKAVNTCPHICSLMGWCHLTCCRCGLEPACTSRGVLSSLREAVACGFATGHVATNLVLKNHCRTLSARSSPTGQRRFDQKVPLIGH